ncbi:hypothetical protein ACROYT_G031191 [Oculina patagonica]
MKLVKVSEGEGENENLIMAELLATDEGVLPDTASILKSNWSRNLSLFPEVTFPDICNYLLGKTDEYSEENLKSLKSLMGYKLFKDGHVLDLQVHKVPDKSAVLVKYQVQPTERSKTGSGKDSYDGIMILRSDGAIHGAFCPCQRGSTELDPVSFMDQLKAGLEEHASSAVILQILPQVPPVEEEVTGIVSNDKCLDHEEEVDAVEVNTISELRDAFLLSKGLDRGKTFDVSE